MRMTVSAVLSLALLLGAWIGPPHARPHYCLWSTIHHAQTWCPRPAPRPGPLPGPAPPAVPCSGGGQCWG